MNKINQYIIKKIVVTFFFALVLLILISIAINTSEQIHNFIRSGLGVWGIFKEYFSGFIPQIAILLFPLVVFISIVIITSRMAIHSEIIAFRASGASYIRFLRPYIFAGIALMALHWALINFVLPKANAIVTDFAAQYLRNNSSTDGASDYYNALYLRSDKNTVVVFKNYSSYQKKANSFFIDYIKNNTLLQRISGRNIEWIEGKQEWKGENVTIKSNFRSSQIKELYKDTMYFRFAFTPYDAVLDYHLKEKLYRWELVKYIAKEKTKGTNIKLLQLELYKRDATPIIILILSIIAAMLSSKKVRGGSGYHIAVGIILMAVYVFLERISAIFATKASFPPLLAAWAPHIIFAIIAIWIYRINCKSPV